MQVLNLKDTKNLYNGNDEILELYAGEKILYKKVEENEYLMTYGKMENNEYTSNGVKFLHPFNLSEVYYIDTGFPVFSIAYMGNDVFALTNRKDQYVYIYKLNRDNNNFELKDTIEHYTIDYTYNMYLDEAIQIVFYYNKNLYFLRGVKYSFDIIKINYDIINFNSRKATIAYNSDNDSISSPPIYNNSPSYYEGSFQIIDNYFLISDKNSKVISTFKILEDGNIERVGYARVYSYDNAYLLNNGNFLITNYKINSDSETIGLGLFKEDILVKEIYKDSFTGCSPYSKTCYFNNKYYINRNGYIYEYDNNLKTIKKINNYNESFSIQISKEEIIYLMSIINTYENKNYSYLNTCNSNFSYQFESISTSSYSVIEPIIF